MVLHSLMLGPSPGAKARGPYHERGVNTGHESIYNIYTLNINLNLTFWDTFLFPPFPLAPPFSSGCHGKGAKRLHPDVECRMTSTFKDRDSYDEWRNSLL